MPRFFVGNFDFEHRLAAPGRELSRHLHRINAELAPAWLAVAEDGDCLWTPEPVEDTLWGLFATAGLPRVTGAVSTRTPPGYERVCWGHTGSAPEGSAPDLATVRAANSRRFSWQLESEWNVGLAGAGAAASLADVEQLLAAESRVKRWVIKAEFGMSGRERRLVSRSLAEADRHWIQKRLQADGIVFVEPWVSALGEAGLQFEIPAPGARTGNEPRFIGLAEMLASPLGQYAGSIFQQPADTAAVWQPAIQMGLQAVRRLQDVGYFGPVGIDAMRYQDISGQERLRPLQDINARWTMGRLALGWRRRFPACRTGLWWHGSRHDLAENVPERLACQRFGAGVRWQIIPTTPDVIGGTPALHQSVLMIENGG